MPQTQRRTVHRGMRTREDVGSLASVGVVDIKDDEKVGLQACSPIRTTNQGQTPLIISVLLVWLTSANRTRAEPPLSVTACVDDR